MLVGITETWLNQDIGDSEISLPGYDLFRHDRPVNREVGGVMLYVKNQLRTSE